MLSLQGVRVHSLVRELRSCKLHSQTNKQTKMVKMVNSVVYFTTFFFFLNETDDSCYKWTNHMNPGALKSHHDGRPFLSSEGLFPC